MSKAFDNPVFDAEPPNVVKRGSSYDMSSSSNSIDDDYKIPMEEKRENWGSGIEFLLSCIAMSVGLGNVWRFPFIALRNGGGAFVIPYIIILFLVGKPGYYLEMVMGQFSSRSTVKVYDCVPAMRGVGIGQMIAALVIGSFYPAIMAITLRYLFYSFTSELPWGKCNPDWPQPCYPATPDINYNVSLANGTQSSAELYFLNEVLRAYPSLREGIGLPNWELVGYLVLIWVIVFIILVKGIRSTGKVAYVTGTAPFVFLVIFLIRALTLPGALDGIAYFFTPSWEDLIKPSVWYAACTQLFLSLNLFFANIIMYSSYNKFDHNVYRDANIVTTIDTFTSVIAGCISFGIVGHLAQVLKVDDMSKVFQGGPGLVFITYAETICKFTFVPYLFSIFFYLMLFILGFGSLIAMTSCVITVIKDKFTTIKTWHIALTYTIYGIVSGSVYLTSAGQSILNLADHFGATFPVVLLSVFEIITFCHIYGVNRICKDIEFMLGFKPGIFWRVCWWAVTPLLMAAIVIYSLIYYENPRDNNVDYTTTALTIGWCITAFACMWLPVIIVMKVLKQKDKSFLEKIKIAFSPKADWGPLIPSLNERYKDFMKNN